MFTTMARVAPEKTHPLRVLPLSPYAGNKQGLFMQRKAISTRTRFEVFKRDSFVCQYCGGTPPNVLLHVDHIVAVANGGGNSMDNLVTACQKCNLGKSAVPLTSIPQSLDSKAAEFAERERQLRAYNRALKKKRDRIEGDAWAIVAALEHGKTQEEYSRQRMQSIRMFLDRMPYEEAYGAAQITSSRFYSINDKAFRYFCGICWSKIKEANGESKKH